MLCLVALLLFDTVLAFAQVQSPPQPADTIGPPSTDATAQTIAVVASVTPAGSYSSLNVYVITGKNPPKVLALPAGVTIGPDVSISQSGDRLAFVAYSSGKPQIAVASQATGLLTLFPADVEGCVLRSSKVPFSVFRVSAICTWRRTVLLSCTASGALSRWFYSALQPGFPRAYLCIGHR